MERMLKENNERMLEALTEQFSQFAIANKEKETFLGQLETNPLQQMLLKLVIS